MSEAFIEQVLAQIEAAKATQAPSPRELAWQVLQSGDLGVLRACLDRDGYLVLQNLNLDPKHTWIGAIPPEVFPALRTLLGEG